ncbi:orotidine-5'-phosphate decarboxylase [Rhizomicrobium palustre]|uniref:Orotidine 5'-phosphate decarboxylase n=1 Tax=Rhizomicrobium palustre TaxID=189966 RepID=A0A846N5R0_9PROT|nr:orotidine-5'-phosphate decarboxylase [Rhizomicrobium palustre]NIK90502.1 orotidine-5'-phosphate decarboxylase [Rhizomicrobium palustre]
MRFPNPVFVALDTPDLPRALELAESVKPYVGGLKVGLEFISALGPDGVKAMSGLGLPVFADVKFHDIPNTVAGAAKAIAGLGVSIFNVHASGGEAMMRAAVEAIAPFNPRPKLIAVTVLTSMDEAALDATGQKGPAKAQVARLAALVKKSGLDGVVCSAHELAMVREVAGPDFLTIVPGIRPAGAAIGDQKRVMTPAEARAAGADILVIGRPITGAADPAAAAQAIMEELGL